MDRIEVLDKTFEIFIPGDKIEKRVSDLADQIADDLKGEEVLFLAVLNGSFINENILILPKYLLAEPFGTVFSLHL